MSIKTWKRFKGIIGYFRVFSLMKYDCSPIYHSRGSDGSFVFFLYLSLLWYIIHPKQWGNEWYQNWDDYWFLDFNAIQMKADWEVVLDVFRCLLNLSSYRYHSVEYTIFKRLFQLKNPFEMGIRKSLESRLHHLMMKQKKSL